MRLKYQHIIWDWNGTLLNDAALCRSVMNSMLERRGLPVMSPHRYQDIFDFPVDRYYARLGFDFTRETFEALGTEFIDSYEQQKQHCRLRPGARAFLNDLKKQGVKQAVLSAYRHDALEAILEEKKLHHCFDWVAGADDHYARGKVEQGLRLIKAMKPPNGTTVMIGDTVHDYVVAQAMEIDCILIEGGHQSAARLATCRCCTATTYDEILSLLRGSF